MLCNNAAMPPSRLSQGVAFNCLDMRAYISSRVRYTLHTCMFASCRLSADGEQTNVQHMLHVICMAVVNVFEYFTSMKERLTKLKL